MIDLKTLEKHWAGKKNINIDAHMTQMLLATLAKYKGDDKRYYTEVRNKAMGPMIKNGADSMIRMMDEAVPLIEVMLGKKGRTATYEEIDRVSQIINEVKDLSLRVDEALGQDMVLQEALRNALKDFTQLRAGAPIRAANLSAKWKQQEERVGGVKGMAAGIRENVTGPGKAFMEGAGQGSPELPKSMGGNLGSNIVMSMLGPLAPLMPLATMAATTLGGGIGGVGRYFKGRKQAKEARHLASLSAMLTGEGMEVPGAGWAQYKRLYEQHQGKLPEWAMGYRGMNVAEMMGNAPAPQQAQAQVQPQAQGQGNWPGRDPKTGKFIKQAKAKMGQIFGGVGQTIGPKELEAAVLAGTFVFFNKEAFNARWTKKVLELLADKTGTGKGGGMTNFIGSLPWGTIGKALMAAGAVTAIVGGVAWAGKSAWDQMQKARSQGRTSLGQQAAAGMGGFFGGKGGLGQEGAGMNMMSGMGKGALIGGGIGFFAGGPIGAAIGAGVGAAIGGIGHAIGGDRLEKGVTKLWKASPIGQIQEAVAGYKEGGWKRAGERMSDAASFGMATPERSKIGAEAIRKIATSVVQGPAMLAESAFRQGEIMGKKIGELIEPTMSELGKSIKDTFKSLTEGVANMDPGIPRDSKDASMEIMNTSGFEEDF